MIAARTITLAATEGLPGAFRLFKSGWNETSKGRFLFDAEAARLTMAAYRRQGIDVMLDLEHLSLDPSAANYDPDARGWCRLELRSDGSLWAGAVRWTSDGAARLSQKRQRYISPAFEIDEASKRVISIINVAITSLPATYATPALIAASRAASRPSPRQFQRLREDPLAPTRHPLPSDVPAAIAAITKALGLPDNATRDDIAIAVGALLDTDAANAPEAIEEAALKLGLSPREAKMLGQMKVQPRKYIELKKERGYKPAPRR